MSPKSPSNEANVTLCSPRSSAGGDANSVIVVRSAKPSWIPTNHVLLRMDKFGFSANNITYQALGEHAHFRYFDFHQAPESANPQCSAKTHGVTPVWGFGTVINSTHPKIKNGERVYGYLAPTRYLLLPVGPADVNKFAFYVPRLHLPADRRPYNQILRCESDPQYTPNPVVEDLTMLYRPLFWTSYWCEDWLHTSGYRGDASAIVISSASAKTAFCLAYLINKRLERGEIKSGTKIIGLTSRRNLAFVKRLRFYHEVLDYDNFTSSPTFQAPRNQRWIYVDVAGNDELNARINSYFASPYTHHLAACVQLGLTNMLPTSKGVSSRDWSKNTFEIAGSADKSEVTSSFWPKMEQFFMPEWLDVRKLQIPIYDIFQRQNQAWEELMVDCKDWVELTRVNGSENVKNAYLKLVKEGLGPDKGFIWSMWDADMEPCPSEPQPLVSRL
ncbi:hypothetical protein CPB83DRAFT_813960 [Crepidotus variabilis]|uniref:DUF2855 family protein n=1 Tax=Crepidotus variabilis TaxID=179855 RepID=A0A9P6JQ54_9AGAR|nr:hypothetical protein CPB83DRAFT_813960 [Crepidotus variabilis]